MIIENSEELYDILKNEEISAEMKKAKIFSKHVQKLLNIQKLQSKTFKEEVKSMKELA